MTFQLHRLFTYGNLFTSSRLPFMAQCRTLQNCSGTCVQFSPFSNGGNFNKLAQLKSRKAGDTCRIATGRLKNHRFKAERGSFLLKTSFDDYRHNCAVKFQTQLRAVFPFSVKYSNSCTSSCLRSNVRFNFSSQECVRRRFFSAKASESSGVQENPMKNGNVRDENTGLSKTILKLSDSFRRPAKQFVVRSSSSNKQIAVSSRAVKKSVSNVIKSAPKSLNGMNPKDGKKDVKLQSPVSVLSQPVKKCASNVVKSCPENLHVPKAMGGKKGVKLESSVSVSHQPVKKSLDDATKSVRQKLPAPNHKDGKNDVKLESLVSTSVKSRSNNENPQAQGKKKQARNKREKALSGSTAPSGDAKINGSKQASLTKKPNVATEGGQSSQVSEILSAGDTPLLKIGNTTLAHEKSVGKPARKRKPQKKVTVHTKPDKIKSSPVVVEVKKRPREKGLKSLYPPTGKSVVVVESLTKAKVIQGYLGDMFEVLPSYGHVRDLAGRSGSVRPDDDFSMVWEVPSAAWTHLKSIKVALNGAENLILASDPDREGEAIAWHVMEMLHQQDALNDNINVSRVVFHEITEPSIKSALQAPRDIDANLVHAYLARRALDYLIGFNISPLLWRKLPSCQSAGRVQSAALALTCDREMEIDEFRPQEYWTVEVAFHKMEPGSLANDSFPSHLTHLDFKKLDQLSISCSEEAHAIEQKMASSSFEVSGSKRSKSRRNPPTPYITSTLQQDAANKLNFSASYTMKLAQKLYEGVKLRNNEATGLITYMRTDGLHVSDVAAKDICSLVIERYGQAFASESPRKYFKKVKNAQEAHEAIRPTSIRRLPSMLTDVLDEDSLKLYSLIWSRTMACQMVPTVVDQIQIDIGGARKFLSLRSTCSKVEFLGYQAAYKDVEAAAIGYHEKEEDTREEAFEVLCKLKTGDLLDRGKVELKQHFTQPPSRYSEGSLIKKLEELGIGRPSTYASTIKVLQDRKYVLVKSRTLHPEFRGRMVSAFLSHHFSEVTDYSFTADMEAELDNVSAGMTEWKGLLKDYWTRFKAYCDRAGEVDIRQVEKMLEKTFDDFLFASLPNKSRTCPSCLTGTLIFKVSRFGAGYFIGCDQHPKCRYIAKTIYGEDEEEENPETLKHASEPKLLGLHPTSNEKVFLKTGPYGSYVQLGEDRKGHAPQRVSVSLIKDVSGITLEKALELLQYPLLLGKHPDDGLPIYLKISQHGFTLRHRRTIAPVPKTLDPKKVTVEKAIKLLLGKDAKQCGRPKKLKLDEEPVEVV